MKLKRIGTYKITNNKEDFLNSLKHHVNKDGKYEIKSYNEYKTFWLRKKHKILNPFSRIILTTEIKGEFVENNNIKFFVSFSRIIFPILLFYIGIGIFMSILFLSNAEYKHFFAVLVFFNTHSLGNFYHVIFHNILPQELYK